VERNELTKKHADQDSPVRKHTDDAYHVQLRLESRDGRARDDVDLFDEEEVDEDLGDSVEG
jgi:hypothetical protein